METAVQAREATPIASDADSTAKGGVNPIGLRHAAANLGVATIFFLTLAFHSRQYGGLSDLIWMIGAALMGMLSLIRVPPKAALINSSSLTATAFMMVTPLFMT